MDIVVILALVVLGFVFILSLIILVITCQRRRHSRAKSKVLVAFETPPDRFTRSGLSAAPTVAISDIDSMEQLNELLGELLDKNPWLYDARGIMQHVVAVLSIGKSMTAKLASVQLPTTPSPFHDAINMAIRNIYPRFDDLIESLATQPIDMRLLEARAMSLGTVCWSLYLPYTLLDARYKEVLQKPLNEMNLHLVTIRTAAHLVAMADKGAGENLDLVDLKDQLMRMRRQIRGGMLLDDDYETEEDMDDDDDDAGEEHDEDNKLVSKKSGSLADHHEKTPLVQSEAIIDMIELTKVPLVDQNKLVLINGTTPSEKLSNSSSPLHHRHHHHHHHLHQNNVPNDTLNTVEEEMNEDDHHHEGEAVFGNPTLLSKLRLLFVRIYLAFYLVSVYTAAEKAVKIGRQKKGKEDATSL
uniref:Transmembrane protein 98 n=2 Tax=Caenorhabditis japonica TaxID=281687 RepID=A0A8R1HLQ0_CAEJA